MSTYIDSSDETITVNGVELPAYDNSRAPVYKGAGTHCQKCYGYHINDYCPRQKQWLKKIGKLNELTKAKKPANARTCPECDKITAIPADDYICSACRDKKAPKYRVLISEATLEGLRDNEVAAVAQVLLRYGLSYNVVCIS